MSVARGHSVSVATGHNVSVATGHTVRETRYGIQATEILLQDTIRLKDTLEDIIQNTM